MKERRSRYAEIVVRVVPTRLSISEEEDSRAYRKEPARSYDASIYTNLHIPELECPDRPPPGEPDTVAGLPLVGLEQVVVRWSRYQEYLAAFVEGAKDLYHMRARLFEVMSPGLEALFSDQPLADRPVRVWWSTETPELADLPWELVAYSTRRDVTGQFAFVRGLPPETPAPLLPVGERLRLAVIHDPSSTPYALRRALDDLPPAIEVIPMTEAPRQALRRAAHEGYELLHIVADGWVSLAYEGILYLHGQRSPELSPGELSKMLYGSRVTVLGLTPPEIPARDVIQMGRSLVPSAYRAFAYLGSSRRPLPSIVAPLGPFEGWQTRDFWSCFYTCLAETMGVEEAMARGQGAGPPKAMALFLRHWHGRLFRRLKPESQAPEVDPAQIEAELQVSRGLVKQLHALGEQFGDRYSEVRELLESEVERQTQLSEELAPWQQMEEDEL